ncbi:hypothetical protein [Mesorhizobium sp. 128a]
MPIFGVIYQIRVVHISISTDANTCHGLANPGNTFCHAPGQLLLPRQNGSKVVPTEQKQHQKQFPS